MDDLAKGLVGYWSFDLLDLHAGETATFYDNAGGNTFEYFTAYATEDKDGFQNQALLFGSGCVKIKREQTESGIPPFFTRARTTLRNRPSKGGVERANSSLKRSILVDFSRSPHTSGSSPPYRTNRRPYSTVQYGAFGW